MSYTFDASPFARRRQTARVSRWISRAGVKAGLGAGIVLALAWWLLLLAAGAGMVMIGAVLLWTSVVAAGVLLYTFVRTYGAALYSARSVAELVQSSGAGQAAVNAAAAADLELLGILGSFRPGKSELVPSAAAQLVRVPAVRDFLRRLHIPLHEFEAGRQLLAATTWSVWSESMVTVAHELNAEDITAVHAVAALLLQPELKTFGRGYSLREEDIRFVAWWVTSLRDSEAALQRWWAADRLLAFSGIGLSWTSGFTPLVDQFSRFPRGNLWDEILYGREQYVEQLITTLARQRQSNVLLVGQPGVGRLGIVKGLAARVQAGTAHPELNGQRVVYVHIGEVLAQGTTSASQLALVSRVLSEVERAGNVIAVIDGLGSVLAVEAEQRLNMTEVLLPFFSSLTVRVVVIISNDEYHLRLASNEELIHFFEVVQVPSASPAATLRLLAWAAPSLERTTGIYLPYQSLREIVDGTEALLPHIPLPERAFDFLEEALVGAQAKRAAELEPADIDALISAKVGVAVGTIRADEQARLLSLEELMHRRVVNQEQAVTAVVRAMIRARAGVRSKQRPIGTFLFLGPTGVGKTETAKTLAEAYFGAEDYLVRLDMSEFQSPNSVDTLIGSHAHPVGRLTALISDRPFTVLLLDEFEKAHASVHQLFLQVFDEAHLTDVRGHTYSFQHVIIIATSNAGAELIRREVKDGIVPPHFGEQVREHILQAQIFRPELLNRFDGVVTFTPLSVAHIRQVAERMMAKLNGRLDAAHGITVAVTPELLDYLVGVGYDPQFGARPMARVIQDTVEYTVAQRILKREVEPGQQVVLQPEGFRS